MAEFDTKAFEAIDKIFAGGKDTKETSIAFDQRQRRSRKEHRLGVGTKPTSNQDTTELNLGKRILQVGLKRSLQQQADEADANDSDLDASQEDDVGRTSYAEPKKRQRNFLVASKEPPASKKQETKKQKKNEKKAPSAKDNDVSASEHTFDNPLDDALGLVIDRKGIDPEPERVEGVADQSAKNKRKRRKVRSKQKNIYKDKREHKPEHLIPGSKNYKGKPMTAETRKKLGLV